METKFNLESLSPNIVVDDVNKTVDYYSKYLDFNLIACVPETGKYNWAMVTRDGVTLMFQSLPSIQEDMPSLKIESGGSRGIFFIKMTGVEELYQSLKEKVTVAVEMRTTFYGMKEFVLKDLNGFFLTFAEEIK